MSERNGLEIAVVGMAGRFPRARSVEELWHRLRDGEECIRHLTADEVIAAGADPTEVKNPRYVKARGIVDDDALFDAAFFGLSPREGELMDPQHRMLLECAWAALESAGYDARQTAGASVGVYAGCGFNTYLIHNVLPNRRFVESVGGFQTGFGHDKDHLAPLIAYKLGLEGPSVTVQSACSTSLVATHLACQALLNGECDLALAGGVKLAVPQALGYWNQSDGFYSSDGHCRAFDRRADGTVPSGGAGIVVLRRLEDAEADGDTVLAVIKGSAVNNDGPQRVGYTAPRSDGQAKVIRAAQLLAEVDPATIQYVETHGSATSLGDPIEVSAMTKAFRAGTDREGYCALGSIKTNIGHADTAAGIAGLIKTVLALGHRQIPPNLHFEEPNPKIELEGSPFYVATELADWPAGEAAPRRAGVSSFGLGGTNAHVVLEEAPEPPPPEPGRAAQVLVLSARSAPALEEATDRLSRHLSGSRARDGEEAADQARPEHLADVAYTLQVGRRSFEHRRAVVCREPGEAARVLAERDGESLLEGVVEDADRAVTFLLPGLGDHYAGMGEGLYRSEPVFREAVDRCAEILEPHLGLDLRGRLYPGDRDADSGSAGLDLRRMVGRSGDAGADDPLHGSTLLAQPAVFVTEYALAQLWLAWGVRPRALVGYSLGEYVAACLAGVFSLEDALALVVERARLVEELAPGAMTAVMAPAEALVPLLGAELSVAAVEGPELTVVAGPMPAMESLEERLRRDEVVFRRLATRHAFHSREMDPVAARLADRVAGFERHPPRVPYLSNVTGAWMTDGDAADPRYWSRHLCGTVRFADALEVLLAEPGCCLLEVGPGGGLGSLALQHPAAREDLVVLASLRHAYDAVDDPERLLATLAKLWLSGVRPGWSAFHRGARRRRLALPTYPFQRRRHWLEPPSQAPAEAGEGVVAATARPEPGPRALRVAVEPARRRHGRPDVKTRYAPPEGPVQEGVAAVWEELLGVAPVGVHDDFFELGGHSLLGTRMLTRVRSAFGVELELPVLFEAPTVAALARRVAEAGGGAPLEARKAAAGEGAAGEPVVLSFSQERLWFLDQFEPEKAAYNIPAAVRLTGRLDLAALGRSFDEVVRRHGTLRTRFADQEGLPVQVVEPPRRVDLPVVDLGQPEGLARERELRRLGRLTVREPFDLERGHLIRVRVVRTAPEEHVLLVIVHHIVSDGWSTGLLIEEIAALYPALAAGRPPALPDLPLQYVDFARSQREALSGEALAADLAYWCGRLEGIPQSLQLPTDRPRGTAQTARGARRSVRLAPELVRRLRGLGAGGEATLFMTLLALFQLLLSRYSGEDDVCVGTPVAGRHRVEVEPLIGFFVNTLVLRTDLSGDPRFRELLARVRETSLEAQSHQALPFEKLVYELEPDRSMSHSPLFQVLFVLQNTPREATGLPGVEVEPVDLDPGTAKFDLTLSVDEDPDGAVRGWLEYNVDLFDATTAARMVRHLETLATAAVEAPEARLSELSVLGAPERFQAIHEWNDARRSLPEGGRGFVARFREQAQRRPEAVAAVSQGAVLTYGALHARAAALSRRLRESGAGPESLVGVFLERSPDLLVALVAILDAGAAYLPLDPSFPAERLSWMLEDGGCRLVLADRGRGGDVLGREGRTVLEVDDTAAGSPGQEGAAARPAADPGLRAYVLYTSGSTGRPKGVQVSRGALANFVAWGEEALALEPGDAVLATTTLSFDISILELLVPLAAGGTVALAASEAVADPAQVERALERSRARAMQATPTGWRMLLDAGWAGDGRLLALCGGEALPADLAGRLRERTGTLVNLYGPTEATVWASSWPVDDGAGPGPAPLGRPLFNTRLHALDRRLRPAPVGAAGQLVISGRGLARGYLGLPARTAERFLPDPHASGPGARTYATGDLVRRLPDGNLEFLGRLDHQVKVRGFRIELGEVEAALSSHPEVREAVVVAADDGSGSRLLVGYVTPEDEAPPAAELRSYLGGRLPPYMVPTAFVSLDAMPLTPNGKVDRKRLPSPVGDRPRPEATFVAPRSETERRVARIWEELLEVESVGVHTSFFEIGGHSLLLVRMRSRVEAELGVHLGIPELFRNPTVAGVARAVDEAGPRAEAQARGGMKLRRVSRERHRRSLSELDLQAQGGEDAR